LASFKINSIFYKNKIILFGIKLVVR